MFRALSLLSIFCYSTSILAVTVIPLTLSLPKPYKTNATPASSDYDLLIKINPGLKRANGPDEMVLQSIYSRGGGINATNGIYAAQDSFVRGAIDASAAHQHLLLRPDDVWFTILTQLGFYMRKHKDDQLVKDIWDSLDGKPPPINNGWVLVAYGQNFFVESVFNRSSKASWLKDWLQPKFPSLPNRPMGTVNVEEDMMANAVFMASSTPSSEYMAPFACLNGIPSISLDGKKEDWIQLADKLTQMEKGTFGKEPALYAHILRPLLDRFVVTFDVPNDPAVRLFWNVPDMITATPRQLLCQTTDIVTGWINGFHFWDANGDVLLPKLSSEATGNDTVRLDNVPYPWRKLNELPTAYSGLRACMSMDTPWAIYDRTSVGMMAKKIKSGIPEGYSKAMQMAGLFLPSEVVESDHSILQPEPVWIEHSTGYEVGPCCDPKNMVNC